MDRKLCSLFLAVTAVFCFVSSVMAADYVCILEGDSASAYSEPDAHEDYPNADESYFGYNYLAKYRIPKVSQLKLYMIEGVCKVFCV